MKAFRTLHTKSFRVQLLTNFLWRVKCLWVGNGLRQMPALAEIDTSQIPGVRPGGMIAVGID